MVDIVTKLVESLKKLLVGVILFDICNQGRRTRYGEIWRSPYLDFSARTLYLELYFLSAAIRDPILT